MSGDFLNSTWICGDEKVSSPLFRTSFKAKGDVEYATLYCTGLGYFEAYINGMKIGDDVLTPAQTDYDYRVLHNLKQPADIKVRTKIYYLKYDVLKLISEGANGLGIWLGNGHYRQTRKKTGGDFNFSIPKTIIRLHIVYKDGEEQNIITDENWLYNESPIIYDNLYFGEVFDANKTINDWCMPNCNTSSWKKVNIAQKPTGTLMLQDCPTDKVQENYKPKEIYKDSNRTIYDVGKNISGWVLLVVSGKKGQEVVMSFAEEIDENNTLDYSSSNGKSKQVQKLTYILNDETIQFYTPKFTWASFRYIEVQTTAQILDLKARFVATHIQQRGSFYCSNQLYNELYQLYINTQRSNMHGGVITDTPHRDRVSQTGVGQLITEPLMLTFDGYSFIKKWVDDIKDSQNLITGYIPNTAPFMGGAGGPGWGAAIIIVPFRYYQQTGDKSILESTYKSMELWMKYLESKTDGDYIIHSSDDDSLFVGEWRTPEKLEIPRSYVNTCIYAYIARLMVYVSEEIEKDCAYYVTTCNNIVKNITNKWYDADSKNFLNGVQGANAFALWVNAVPKKDIKQVAQNMADYIINECEGHLDTGMFGTPVLLDMLTKYGHGKVAFNIMNKKTYPSFGYMYKKEATTLWETFDGKRSHNHTMFGTYVAWYIRSIVGINVDFMSPGYDNVIINPSLVAYFDFADGKVTTANGELVSVSWHKHGDIIVFDIILPEYSTYKFFCPKGYDVINSRQLSEINHCITIKRNKFA